MNKSPKRTTTRPHKEKKNRERNINYDCKVQFLNVEIITALNGRGDLNNHHMNLVLLALNIVFYLGAVPAKENHLSVAQHRKHLSQGQHFLKDCIFAWRKCNLAGNALSRISFARRLSLFA